jgi:hypothetical protein
MGFRGEWVCDAAGCTTTVRTVSDDGESPTSWGRVSLTLEPLHDEVAASDPKDENFPRPYARRRARTMRRYGDFCPECRSRITETLTGLLRLSKDD